MKYASFIVALFFVFFSSSGQTYSAGHIRTEDYSGFQSIVQAYGYTCSKCDGGHVLGQGVKGINFRVYCNDNQLVYFVTTGKNYICVEPWDKKGTKCEE